MCQIASIIFESLFIFPDTAWHMVDTWINIFGEVVHQFSNEIFFNNLFTLIVKKKGTEK